MWYYFCKIVNTLGESHTSANTQMIRVEVTKKQEPVRTEISVRMPSSSGTYEVLVKVGGETQIEAFTVDMARAVQPVDPPDGRGNRHADGRRVS